MPDREIWRFTVCHGHGYFRPYRTLRPYHTLSLILCHKNHQLQWGCSAKLVHCHWPLVVADDDSIWVQNATYKSMCAYCNVWVYHWLTPRKGVHLFRYFLHSMCTPLWLFHPHAYLHFYCFAVYALSAKTLNAYTKDLWCTHWMRTP